MNAEKTNVVTTDNKEYFWILYSKTPGPVGSQALYQVLWHSSKEDRQGSVP